MKLYMYTTKDKYELPIAVADSKGALAIMLGRPVHSVQSCFSKKHRGYVEVEVDDGDEINAQVDQIRAERHQSGPEKVCAGDL